MDVAPPPAAIEREFNAAGGSAGWEPEFRLLSKVLPRHGIVYGYQAGLPSAVPETQGE